ncbi:MAG: phosphoenolpyruvate mutase [Deltaproteobacteria bacterium]|jgi:phosphoenolpyruvate phosphomutase|nr:phosphoenolpyruvate mutase [Deltaproteobacteria bacterium]
MTEKTVFMSFSSDIIHGGHTRIIQRAAKLGKLTIGALTDEAIAGYKRFPLLTLTERMEILRNINGVGEVVVQKTLAAEEELRLLKPDYVVHGDDWRAGPQMPVRGKIIELLKEWGGELVEYPYSADPNFSRLEGFGQAQMSMPDFRRGRLKRLFALKPLVTAIEAHNGLTGLLAEKVRIPNEDGSVRQFDAMWLSSLCDSTAKGKPDIELVDMTSRLRTVDDIMEVTTKPIVFDGDTGGLSEHFTWLVRTLERVGVSAIIIEDKKGLKKNSLLGVSVVQEQDTIEDFSAKIRAGKQAQLTKELMIVARIESLILEKGHDDALKRAAAYLEAGADGIMIHSRLKNPSEIFKFCEDFRKLDDHTPLVVVPTSFSSVREEEFRDAGVNLVIYANHLLRSAFPAMKKTAETILKHRRALEADEFCMPFQEIITLIPDM